MLRFFRLAITSLCFGLCWLQAADTQGHLIMIGGGKRPPEIMEKFFELAGGKEALIVVIPTASSLDDTGEFYQKQFSQDFGCKNVVWLDLKTKEDAANPQFSEQISKAGGIFFAGGDQRKITAAILGTPLEKAIREAYQNGAAICGTSAGTACMSQKMITGDGNFEVIRAGAVETTPGLGLFPNAILDQHFIARQRQNRLITVTLENPETFGIGIDEATAVWLKPDHSIEVLGHAMVQIYDARRATIRKDGEAGNLSATDVTMHLLVNGDQFKLIQ